MNREEARQISMDNIDRLKKEDILFRDVIEYMDAKILEAANKGHCVAEFHEDDEPLVAMGIRNNSDVLRLIVSYYKLKGFDFYNSGSTFEMTWT